MTFGSTTRIDVAAAAAVAAVRAAERLELLPVHGGAAVAAVAGRDVQHDPVDERGHVGSPTSMLTANCPCDHDAGGTADACAPPAVSSLAGAVSSATGTMLTTRRPRLMPNSHGARGQREQRVVAAAADVVAGVEVGAALADDDLAGVDQLAAEALDAEALGVGVAAVPRGATRPSCVPCRPAF